MSTYTTNYNLEKPDSGDDFKDFRSNYNSNMDIIDANLGGGGGSSVSWQQLQVTGDKIATIRISSINTDVYSPNSQTFSMAISRANINSDEKYSTIFGKIKKWFADLKTVAFTANASDLNNDAGFITNTVNNLANYYLKSETYTQAEVNALIGAITTIHFEVVQTLPTSDIQTNVIYLVPKSTAGTNDVYDEYINTTGTSAGWELIGSTQVDLSNYYTKTQTDTLLDGKVSDVKVNDTSVVDSSHVANITSYEEVTIAQYNALPASKKNCGIAYFIKDLDNASVEGYPPLIYSLEEREVGVWTDGKPLYKRTFYLATASLSSKEFSISTGLSNIEKIITCTGVLTDGSETYTLPFERLTERESIRMFARANSDGTVTLNVITGVGGASVYSDVTDIFATIYYTKTTDIAGSGIWNGQGGLAHHYSTNETVVGTWIDGKPLYEKVIDFGTLPNNYLKSIGTDVSDIGLVIKVDGFAYSSSATINIPYIEANSSVTKQTIDIWHNTSSNKVEVNTNFNASSFYGFIVIQYTKTTDV